MLLMWPLKGRWPVVERVEYERHSISSVRERLPSDSAGRDGIAWGMVVAGS